MLRLPRCVDRVQTSESPDEIDAFKQLPVTPREMVREMKSRLEIPLDTQIAPNISLPPKLDPLDPKPCSGERLDDSRPG
jgi:hypothetical protein